MLILSKFSLLGYLRKNVNKSIWQNNKRESWIFKNCLTSLYYTSKNPFQNKITSYLKTFPLLLFSKYKITMSSNFDENHPPISILVLFLVQKKKTTLCVLDHSRKWRGVTAGLLWKLGADLPNNKIPLAFFSGGTLNCEDHCAALLMHL